MNVGRFVGAVLATWIVRSLLNFLFYGLAMSAQYQELMAQYPGVFREVIPGFIATDLVFALIFVYLWVKAGASFGGGAAGGAVYGCWIGLFFGLVWNLYYFFGFTFVTVGDVAIDTLYTVVSVAIQGAVAGAVYKHVVPATGAGATSTRV